MHGPYSVNVDIVVTRVNGDMILELDYHALGDIYGLPYNLFGLMVLKDQDVILHRDFTSGCRGAGISLFPGQGTQVGKIKGQISEIDEYNIIVWGR